MSGAVAPALSVISPTWCEATRIARTIANAATVADEVIVADGQSPDGTAEIARAAGARVVVTSKGRGQQLNSGARMASGAMLLFLHADSTIACPEIAREAFMRALANREIGGGSLRLLFVGGGRFGRLFTWANHLRRRHLHIYYGDSGIFVRREVFATLGGFRPYPICEDYDFVRRLERMHRTAYLSDVTLHSSARRFAQRPLRTLMRWILLQLLFSLGVSPCKLAYLYPDRR